MPLVDVHQLSDAITIEHFGDVQKNVNCGVNNRCMPCTVYYHEKGQCLDRTLVIDWVRCTVLDLVSITQMAMNG